jgi:hypothetical protein
LKAETFESDPIEGPEYVVVVSGVWLPESKDDPSKSMVFPEQTKVDCTESDKTCRAYTVSLGVMPDEVRVEDVYEDDYHIDSWDAHSLRASYGPDPTAKLGSGDRCHHHVLTMTFASGAVSLSDIPTREKGCEVFTDTNTYRLANGQYYVDTSPGNDLDKPKKE